VKEGERKASVGDDSPFEMTVEEYSEEKPHFEGKIDVFRNVSHVEGLLATLPIRMWEPREL
jgi:hypothetical protein